MDFDCTRAEFEQILNICRRYESFLSRSGLPDVARTDLLMDIAACHRNGCPLNLAALAEADELDFVHDVAGIQRHIDRRTGKLTDCFMPRSAQV